MEWASTKALESTTPKAAPVGSWLLWDAELTSEEEDDTPGLQMQPALADIEAPVGTPRPGSILQAQTPTTTVEEEASLCPSARFRN